MNLAEASPALRKPVFTKVSELRPGTSGLSLNVKVISTKMVMQRGGCGRPSGPQARQMRIAECLVGDGSLTKWVLALRRIWLLQAS